MLGINKNGIKKCIQQIVNGDEHNKGGNHLNYIQCITNINKNEPTVSRPVGMPICLNSEVCINNQYTCFHATCAPMKS